MRATVYWIAGPWRGRLAILPRPRGGDWLEDEIRSWHLAGINVVVSSLMSDEITELDLTREAELCQANGMEYIAIPIKDREVPSSLAVIAEMVRQLESKLAEGKHVAIHCRAGVGRSALLAACLLAASGLDLDRAFGRIREARGCSVPDTPEQREWVARFARDFSATLSKN